MALKTACESLHHHAISSAVTSGGGAALTGCQASASTTSDGTRGDDGCCHSPKPTRTAANASTSAPGTGQRTRTRVEQLEAEQLSRRFQTEEWRTAHADKSIHEIIVTYSNHDEITERGKVDHEFTSLTGKMSSYSYMMLARDQIARRERSCWCEGCFHQLGRKTLESVGSKMLVCGECKTDKAMVELGIATEDRPSTWHEQEMKDLGTGLAGRRIEAQAQGHKFAQMIKPAGFLSIQARERWSTTEEVHYRPGHYWVAQAPDVLEVGELEACRSSQPSTLNPHSTLNPQPSTLNPQPSTLNPQPSTLNPLRCAQSSSVSRTSASPTTQATTSSASAATSIATPPT